MSDYQVVIHCPEEWTKGMAEILTRRLAQEELPDGLLVEIREVEGDTECALLIMESGRA